MVEPVPSHLSWMIGDVVITRVEESILPLPTKVLVPDITPDQIELQRPWVNPYFEEPDGDEPVLRLSVHSFVIQSEGKTIVVDTCVGPDSDRGLDGDPGFLERLDMAIDGGLDAVDVVVCTHLHFDHVGWNTVARDGFAVPAFPNARYLVTAAEMDELERDDHMAIGEPSIKPLMAAGVLDVIEVGDDGHPVTDEVHLISTPGHTPGHVSVLITSAGETTDQTSEGDVERTALITGDAFHSPLQFAYPDLAAWRFDSDSAQSTATRQAMLDRFADSETVVLGTHFAPPTAGHLRTGNHGVWLDPV